ncbi:hypothetical protein HDV01_001793 [Terramyces sp. JEL0728]|nr:hypothetical protein HDV01_001793 [Terramyces sp. JEL0728]
MIIQHEFKDYYFQSINETKDFILSKEIKYELAESCLNAFIQAGWTGPSLEFKTNEHIKNAPADWDKIWLQELTFDGEDCYPLVQEPFLLWVAKILLLKYRTAFMIQRILDNPSFTLQNIILESLNSYEPEDSAEARARYYLELGVVHHYYAQDQKAFNYFKQAQEASGLQWDMTGVLGKRTKFQTFETSQLVIEASSKLSTNESAKNTPKKLELNDDTLLETIEFTESEKDNDKLSGNLNAIDQTILLGFCLNVKNTNPTDGLTTEEMFPYVTRVLKNPNNWMITTMALILRSRLESKKSRTVERSVLQLQTLVDQWKHLPEDAPVEERLAHFYSLLLPSKWEMEKELGERYVSIGVTRSALEIFERLELWENVIQCHQMLEQTKKAEELIRSLLETNNSPKLWCLLGDVTEEVSHYEKAWEISGNRFARAMRSLGSYYFRVENYQKSLECYQKAVALNALFESSWFVLGCAALRVENDEVAAQAFARVTTLDSDNAEAWNNLASIYIKQKKLVEAFRCLREALKSKYDAGNIWENYLFVAVDIGEFSEAIRAAERVFSIRIESEKLKNTAVDAPVIDVIATAIIKGVSDANEQSSSKHAGKFASLLDLITSKYSSYKVFEICAKFYKYTGELDLWLDCSIKGYRHLLHDPLVNENAEAFRILAHAAVELSNRYCQCKDLKYKNRMGEDVSVCADWAYQAKMAVKSVISKTKVM